MCSSVHSFFMLKERELYETTAFDEPLSCRSGQLNAHTIPRVEKLSETSKFTMVERRGLGNQALPFYFIV